MMSTLKSTQILSDLGQSLWLDNITRDMLDDGTLRRYRDDSFITGLTSNPTIFQEAIAKGHAYDEQIQELSEHGVQREQLFAELAIADLRRAADIFRPIYDHSNGLDGWVSMEVSPLLINDTKATVLAAKAIHSAADRPNLFVKIPGSIEGISAIEETIFAGIPVNVTLLFSRNQYLAAAHAYMRAIERRIAAGFDPNISSVASVFVSRWDKAIVDKVAKNLHNTLGIAIAQQTYGAYWELVNSRPWRILESRGARPQRLLWASTGTKDPAAPPDLYVSALAAPRTINTMPENTLLAFLELDGRSVRAMSNSVDPEPVLAEFQAAGIDIDELAAQLQDQGGKSFVKSWESLLERIAEKQKDLVT